MRGLGLMLSAALASCADIDPESLNESDSTTDSILDSEEPYSGEPRCPDPTFSPASSSSEYRIWPSRLFDNNSVDVSVYFGELDEESSMFEASIRGGSGRGWDADFGVDFDAVVTFSCNDVGTFLVAVESTWTIASPFGEFEVEQSAKTVYDPPVLLLPADLSVGDSWEADSTRSVTQHGDTYTEDIEDTRTFEGYTDLPGPNYLDPGRGYEGALHIQSARGLNEWYWEPAGLVRSNATNYGGGASDPDMED